MQQFLLSMGSSFPGLVCFLGSQDTPLGHEAAPCECSILLSQLVALFGERDCAEFELLGAGFELLDVGD